MLIEINIQFHNTLHPIPRENNPCNKYYTMSATVRVNKLQSRHGKREILHYKLHAAVIIQ